MRIRTVSRLLNAVIICAGLAACSFNERIADHAIDYNKTVEEAHNSLLLLNILRAKDRGPMHFTAISQVRGKLTLKSTGSLGLKIPFGEPSNVFPLTPSIELSQTSSPSFDIAILDTKQFMSGILSPIKKSLFAFYWHQGWPQEVLLYLFIHKVDISYNPWKKETSYPSGTKIVENGFVWESSGGKSGTVEPEWGTKPPPSGSTVQDMDIIWTAFIDLEKLNKPLRVNKPPSVDPKTHEADSGELDKFEKFMDWVVIVQDKGLDFGISKTGQPSRWRNSKVRGCQTATSQLNSASASRLQTVT